MDWIEKYPDLRLDIIGLIAVLGEGSITRNAQVSSLCWWSIIPRLLPAPQALIEHERKARLETKPGIVVGAYSGNVRNEINFFASLLHGNAPPDNNVELVKVTARKTDQRGDSAKSFGANHHGFLLWLSVIGCAMSIALFGLSVHYKDGFGLLAIVTLSGVSSMAGLGAHWSLSFKEPPPPITKERGKVWPRSDLVIYYPNGAMRVIRAEERIARLYFQPDHCEYLIPDTPYRILAFFATLTLMAGVVSLANATIKVQIAFAAAYVILNALYWTASALNPRHYHWVHRYETQILQYKRPSLKRAGTTESTASVESMTQVWKRKLKEQWQRWHASSKHHKITFDQGDASKPRFKEALWVSIFLTGTSRWLNEATHIAPISDSWKSWLQAAERQVQLVGPEESEDAGGLYEMHQLQPARRIFSNMFKGQRQEQKKSEPVILIPTWDFESQLTQILEEHAPETRKVLRSELPEDRQNLPLVSPQPSGPDSDNMQKVEVV